MTKPHDKEIEEFTNMIAKHLADSFGCPCNFSPLDVEMYDYCDECNSDDTVECWKRVCKMWQEDKKGE